MFAFYCFYNFFRYLFSYSILFYLILPDLVAGVSMAQNSKQATVLSCSFIGHCSEECEWIGTSKMSRLKYSNTIIDFFIKPHDHHLHTKNLIVRQLMQKEACQIYASYLYWYCFMEKGSRLVFSNPSFHSTVLTSLTIIRVNKSHLYPWTWGHY